MSSYNSTVSDFRAVEINMQALSIIQDSTMNAGDTMVEIALLSLLFGILTVLSFTSTYFLVRRGSSAHTSVRVLILSTGVIYMSTGIYVAALTWNRWDANHLISRATDGIFSPSYDGLREMAAFEGGMRKQFAMAVFGIEINWIIGDAIVWWRACVIWRNNAVSCVGPVLVACTLGRHCLSISIRALVAPACSPSADSPNVSGLLAFRQPGVVQTTGLALLEVYNPFLEAFAILSLATNVLATSLIAYKAWEHRRFVKKYFSEAGTKSQVLKTLALLVESGSVYCALMTFIIVYYTRQKLVPPAESPAADAGLVFAKAGGTYFVYGCIGPLVAIYPTIIVFIIALKQSPIDNGVLSQVYQTSHRNDRLGAGNLARGPVGEDAKSTIVFLESAFQTRTGSTSTEGEDMEDSRELGMEAGHRDRGTGSTRSRGSSMTASVRGKVDESVV